MRIFGYLGIGFLIVWLLVPTSIAMAETATIEAVRTKLPPERWQSGGNSGIGSS